MIDSCKLKAQELFIENEEKVDNLFEGHNYEYCKSLKIIAASSAYHN